MKPIRSMFRQLGRGVLILALGLSVSAGSAAGGALVLHQHGVRAAHWHVLGCGDLSSNGALPSTFKLGSRSNLASHLTSKRVRTLAIVATGSVFVSTSSETAVEKPGPNSAHTCPSAWTSGTQATPVDNLRAFFRPAVTGRASRAAILLRNHTLLL